MLQYQKDKNKGLKTPPKVLIPAMYRTNFNPKIFTDITIPDKQSYGPNIGKKAVKSVNNFL